MKKRLLCLLLAAVILVSLALPAGAADSLDRAIASTAEYLIDSIASPQIGNMGGEWAVLGLARSGEKTPEGYFSDYYKALVAYVAEKNGVLSDRKYTEYSRVILALSAIGADATDVGGFDLTLPLGDFDKTVWQGLNGPVWALVALDSASYPVPVNETASVKATRQMYVDRIIEYQLPDGGWTLSGKTGSADADVTAMALQALAKYTGQDKVKDAVSRALDCLSAMQDEKGGFATYGTLTCESSAQVLTALCELGISWEDPRFIKNGYSVLDNILSYMTSDGAFRHVKDGEANQMATEQAFYSLVDARRLRDGQNSLYRMGDAEKLYTDENRQGKGLSDKHPDVKAVPVTDPDVSFSDISGHENESAILELARRGIINGMGDGTFSPDATMTRAQFAAITVRALGLTPKENGAFSDVPSGTWFAPYIGTANTYGIVNGVGDGLFAPNGTITRQEAATMVARAAKLCGYKTDYDAVAARNVLAQFGDYRTVADWAMSPMAFCYDTGILDDSVMNIEPTELICRCEVAQMLYNMLKGAMLLG